MEEETTCTTCTCGAGEAPQETPAPEEAQKCEGGSCDVEFNIHEDTKFATLLMLVPMLTLSAFNMMGLL